MGKFITKSNDYFYPAAAPIIYGFFLLTVVLYLQVRRRGGDSPRAQFYAVLDQLPAVIDGHLEPDELAELTGDLRRLAAQDSDPALADLSTRLLQSLTAGSLPVAERPPGRRERWWAGVRSFSRQHLTRGRHRVLLALGLGLPQVFSLLELGLLLLIVLLPDSTTHAWGDALFTAGELDSLHNLLWFVVRFWLDGIVGLLAITGTVLLLVGKERSGLALGVMALVLSLTVNNLLTFYLDQFEVLTFTLVQAAVLLLAVSYRRRYRGGVITRWNTLNAPPAHCGSAFAPPLPPLSAFWSRDRSACMWCRPCSPRRRGRMHAPSSYTATPSRLCRSSPASSW